MSLRDKIIDLKSAGKSYNQIAKELNCSKSTVSYHLSEDQRKSSLNRQTRRRYYSHSFVKKTEAFKYNSVGKANQDDSSGRIYVFSWTDVKDKFGDDPRCYATGRKIDVNDPSSFNFDHIVSVKSGGDNSLENLGLLCTQANLAKREYSLDEFINMCEEIYLHKHGRLKTS